MKTGKPAIALSKRLSESMAQQRADQADLMRSQMESFQQDLQSISGAALSTMQSDIQKLREQSFDVIRDSSRQIENSMAWITELSWMGPKRAALIVGPALLLMSMASWILAWITIQPQMSLTSWGLAPAMSPDGPVLVIDGDQAELTTCRLSDHPQLCLIRKD